jgi:hypothetical protein
MKPQKLVRWVNSPALRVEGVNGVSSSVRVVVVTGFTHQFELVVVVVIGWVVVIHAASPGARVVIEEALQAPPLAVVASSLITIELGTSPVPVLLRILVFRENDSRASGVTVHVQQASSSSVGSMA